MADFEAALGETRASVTPEMLEEYERIQKTLKSEAVRPDGHRLRASRNAPLTRRGRQGSGGLERRQRSPRPDRQRDEQERRNRERQVRADQVERHAKRRSGDPADPVRGGDHARNAALLGERDGERRAAGEAGTGEPEPERRERKGESDPVKVASERSLRRGRPPRPALPTGSGLLASGRAAGSAPIARQASRMLRPSSRSRSRPPIRAAPAPAGRSRRSRCRSGSPPAHGRR